MRTCVGSGSLGPVMRWKGSMWAHSKQAWRSGQLIPGRAGGRQGEQASSEGQLRSAPRVPEGVSDIHTCLFCSDLEKLRCLGTLVQVKRVSLAGSAGLVPGGSQGAPHCTGEETKSSTAGGVK